MIDVHCYASAAVPEPAVANTCRLASPDQNLQKHEDDPLRSSRCVVGAMPSLANLANKELRFALLALFPSADLKLVSEAARCGDLDVASDFIRNALSECSTATAAAAAVSDPPSDPLPVEMPGKSTIGDAKEKAELASLPLAEPPPVSDFPDEAIDAASREVVKRKAARSGYDPARPAQGSLTADGWEIKCNVNLHKTCQSLRTLEYPILGFR